MRRNPWSRSAYGLFLMGFFVHFCRAEISFHGAPDTLTGAMVIPADKGTQAGGNLFHSFSKFNIDENESATFTGPVSVINIVGRVTNSSNRSKIDGVLRSDIAGANVFLLNPAGVVFGANAKLEITGSFHASSAHYLELEDGAVFHTDPNDPMNSPVLTSAAPAAFGFVANQAAASIAVNETTMTVNEGKTITLVGGNPLIGGEAGIALNGATLQAPGGYINLVARTDREGKVLIDAARQNPAELNDIGDISIIATQSEPASITVENDIRNAGSVIIRGRAVTLSSEDPALEKRAAISARTGNMDGLSTAVTIDATSIVMERRSTIDAGNQRRTSGLSGDIRITVGDKLSLGDASINSNTRNSDGESGGIFIEAPNGSVTLGPSSTINSSATDGGTAGKIDIKADRLSLQGPGASITATTGQRGEKRPGDIVLSVKELQLVDGGLITNSVDGEGSGGKVVVVSDKVDIRGAGSGIESKTEGSANGGSISIDTPSITIADGAVISSRTFDEGSAGNIVLSMRSGTISISGEETLISTESRGTEQNEGKAGAAGMIEIRGANQMAVSGGAITSKSTTSGNAGKIGIEARRITLDNGASISTASEDPRNEAGDPIKDANGNVVEATGDPGAISISNNEQLSISGGAKITAATATRGSNGNVIIHSSGTMAVSGSGSEVSTETTGGGAGGAIDIAADQLVVENGATVTASTSSGGDGGPIAATANTVHVRSGGSVKSSTSSTGKAGTITINGETGGSGSVFISGMGSQVSTESNGMGVDAGAGGAIDIYADQLVVENGGNVTASTSSGGDGGPIAATANTVHVRSGGSIKSSTSSAGKAGTITINPRDKVSNPGSVFVSGLSSQISTETTSREDNAGAGGKIEINADQLVVGDGASVTVSTSSSGAGGRIAIRSGQFVVENGATVTASTSSGGDGGPIAATANTIHVRSGGSVKSSTSSAGKAGTITINGETGRPGSVFVSGMGSQVSTESNGVGVDAGAGGGIDIDADQLVVENGGNVTASTTSAGKGGSTSVTAHTIHVRSGGSIRAGTSGSAGGAGGSIFLTHGKTQDSNSFISVSGAGSKISTATSGTGDGGRISIKANRLVVEKEARVTASASAGAAGKIGAVDIAAKEITIRDKGGVTAENDGITDSPRETQLALASDILRLQRGGRISLQTATATAGNMKLNVADTLSLFNGSEITTSAAGGDGDGGDIDIDPKFVILDETSKIEAKAKRGRGGNIRIVTDFLLGPRENISASSELGISGNVEITAVNSDVVSSIQQLPENFQDASGLMKAPCAARLAGKSSSLFVSGRQGLASQPDALVASRVSGATAPASGNPKLANNRHHAAKPSSVLLGCNATIEKDNVL